MFWLIWLCSSAVAIKTSLLVRSWWEDGRIPAFDDLAVVVFWIALCLMFKRMDKSPTKAQIIVPIVLVALCAYAGYSLGPAYNGFWPGAAVGAVLAWILKPVAAKKTA